MLFGEVWFEGYCKEDGECDFEEFEPQGKHVFSRCSEPEDGLDGVVEEDGLDSSEWFPDRQGVKNKKLGKRGEDAAARYLEFRGYEILERNWECPAGEADIIARDGDCLVFIEVKTRKGIGKGFPEEAVTPKKRRRYERIAAWYLMEFDTLDIPMRFDVVALLVLGKDRAMIKHYVNAFGSEC